MRSRLVYTTTTDSQTVTIDYDQTLRLFLTAKEHHPFSAERILRMLNGWAKIGKVTVTRMGRCHIAAENGDCILTQAAMTTLSHLYLQRRDWQIEYPFVAHLLAYGSGAAHRHREMKGEHYAPSFTKGASG